jgi:hypothetical protein
MKLLDCALYSGPNVHADEVLTLYSIYHYALQTKSLFYDVFLISIR